MKRNIILYNAETNDILSTSSRPGRNRYDKLISEGYKAIGSCGSGGQVRPSIPTPAEDQMAIY